MNEHEWLAERFETDRTHLKAVALRMLGSQAEAEDAVQETWLRLSRADTSDVENLSGWLTTVVARVCLDMLRSRTTRREEALGDQVLETVARSDVEGNPEREVLLADSIGLALLVVLETLSPAERVAFVLHDLFGVPFDEVAPIVDRSPAAARQLASRARRRVQGSSGTPDPNHVRRRAIVDAFLSASRGGDFTTLLTLLDPNVVLRTDETGVAMAEAASSTIGSSAETRGAQAVAETFNGRAKAARLALIDGEPGLIWWAGKTPKVVFRFTFSDEKIVAIDLIADPEQIGQMELASLK